MKQSPSYKADSHSAGK